MEHEQNNSDNTITLDTAGVIRLTYHGPQTQTTLLTLNKDVYRLIAEQRAAGKKVLVVADMRHVPHTDSGARVEAKSFLEQADYDALALIGNRYLQPLIFFVLRDYKRDRAVKYFTNETAANKWIASPTPSEHAGPPKPHNRLQFIVIPLVLLTVVGTIASWQQAKGRLDANAQKAFAAETINTTDALTGRLRSYTDALQGFRGFFHSSDSVNELEYQDYFSSLDLNTHYPGFNSINYISRVTDASKAAFVAKARSDRSLLPGGNPSFAITPDSNRAEHFVVTFTGVVEGSSGKGVDLASNDDRRKTLEAARDSGKATATNTIQLLNNQGKEQHTKGFLVAIPIYKDTVPGSVIERRTSLEGFVNAVFDYNKLLKETFGTSLASGAAIQVRDVQGDVVYRQGRIDSSMRKTAVRIPVTDHEWTLEIYAPVLFGISRSEAALPQYVITLGALLTVFMIAVFWLQNNARQRAVDLASAMTADIKHERNIAVATRNKDEAILFSIGDAVLVLDNNGKVVLFNKAAELISSVTKHEALGKHYKDVVPFYNEQTGQPAYTFITDALSGKRSEMAQHTMLKRQDGRSIPVADSAAPVLNSEGTVEGAVVVFRDITRERQLEHMKDEFLSVASHELRTPMGAVRANISMILDGDYGPINKELVEPLTDMKASTIRLVSLVNDLLNVTRIEAGRMQFNLADTPINDTLASTVASLSPLGKEKGVNIIFNPTEDASVQADTDKVKQVLTNLIGNALKFTDKGSIAVSTKLQNDMLAVAVTDTGIGISPEDQQRLFGRFKQITSAQDGKPAGTGLGLYISREIIRKMGGDLHIERSVPGQGSSFVFTLPASGTTAAANAKQLLARESHSHPDQK